ncbi:hypothetical protein QYE76_028047 [Lolium multiflorum]|uniref:CCHC-type domain-containing protein n=1 Tax=Lolium multiflorum TaxID=4521 RepID=A0AAD8QLX0_LOLMU|nr:hypothetical protein QYE76_028047 [Lolium multiflorum]
MESTASRPPGFPNRWQREPSTESVSSASPRRQDHVSALGLSSASSGGNVAAPGRAALAQGLEMPRGRVQDRLAWEVVPPSKKTMWKRRVEARDTEVPPGRPAAGPAGWEAAAPVIEGLCFRCYEPGHRKKDCTNAEVCVRCWHSGHPAKDCKRPRSPSSEEELRRFALSKLARHRSPVHEVPRSPWGHATWEASPSPPPPPRRSPLLPPPPPPLPASRLPPMEAWPPLRVEQVCPANVGASNSQAEAVPAPLCVVRRTAAVCDMEQRLQFASVVSVGGRRPAVTCAQVVAAMAWRGVPASSVSVHCFSPEDFIAVFESEELRRHVASMPAILVAGAPLLFRPWNRQAQAKQVDMSSKVSLVLEGIPPHAWDVGVVEDLLGQSCAIEEIAPETKSRADLSLFRLSARTSEVGAIPVARTLAVPEPVAMEERRLEDPSPTIKTLQYKVLIHLVHIEEDEGTREPGLVRRPPGDGQQGPAEGGSGDGRGGGGGVGTGGLRRVSRSLPWKRVVPDQSLEASPIGPANQGATAVPDNDCVSLASQEKETGAEKEKEPILWLDAHDALPLRADPEVEGQTHARFGEQCDLDPSENTLDENFTSPVNTSAYDSDKPASPGPFGGYFTVEISGSSEAKENAVPRVSGNLPQTEEAPESQLQERSPYSSHAGAFNHMQHHPRTTSHAEPLREDALSPHTESLPRSVPVSAEVPPGGSDVQEVVEELDATQFQMGVDSAALARIRTFCARIVKSLAPPLLKELETSRLNAQAVPFTPRRITRRTANTDVAGCSTKGKKASSAETVLLQALGITRPDLSASEEDLESLKNLFDSPICEQHIRVMAGIFGKMVPPNFETADSCLVEVATH